MPLFATNTQPQARHLHRGDAGQRNLTPAEIEELNKSFDPLNDLGIQIKEGRPVNTERNVPRIFITAPDRNLQDGAKTLSELNIEYGSPEFWRHVQLGNVFVYPAGQHKPSQLQLSAKGKDAPTLSLSEPIADNKIPERKIKKPNIFHRALQFLIPSFKERVKSYDNQANSNTGIYLSVRDHMNKRTEFDTRKEKDDIEKIKHNIAEKENARKNFEENKHIKEDYNNQYEPQEHRFDMLDRVYGLKFVPTEKMKTQWASPENMSKLTDYSKELKMEEVKNYGKKRFDEDDFATISYYTCLKTENLERNMKRIAEYDPQLEPGLKNAGLSAEDAHEIAANHGNNNASTDIFDRDPERGSTGDLIIENTLQPARKQTKEAFLAYKEENKKPLAELVANAVKQAARSHAGMSINEPPKFRTMNSCILKQAGRLSELLEKDPDLEKIAAKDYNMTKEDLELVKGLGQYKKLDDARKTAKEKLSDAAIHGTQLDEELKQKYVKDIVKADYVENTMVKDITDRKHSKKTEELSAMIMGNLDMKPRKGEPTAPGKINASKGQEIILNKLPAMFDERSTFVRGLSADSPVVNAAADKIIATDNLYEKNMSPGKLYEKVMSGVYSTNAQNEAAKEVVAQEEKLKKKEPEKKGPTIDNRAKMFENKGPQKEQQNGPQIGGPV